MPLRAIKLTYRVARRVVISVVGLTVLALGVLFIVTPGPAFIVIPAGLAILGLEFAWARRWLKVARDRARDTLSRKSRSNND